MITSFLLDEIPALRPGSPYNIEADLEINLAKLKTHAMLSLTLGEFNNGIIYET